MLKTLTRGSAPLTTTGLAMLALVPPTLLGLVLDTRTVTGAPVWLKPLKFEISVAIYTLTLAWVFAQLPAWTRMRRVVGWVSSIVFAVEIPIILVQAARGTASHFNVSTPLDGALFGVMGMFIYTQTAATVAVAVALWRQTFADRALGWALRLGMTITLLGAASGGLMLPMSPSQRASVDAGQPPARVGGHTVGAEDGGPGLPGTGWSVEHGDLRVGHFVGLHALQFLALVALGLRRLRVSEPARVRATLVAAVSHVALFAILLWQALRGQSVIDPDNATAIALAAWAALTAAGVSLALARKSPVDRPAIA